MAVVWQLRDGHAQAAQFEWLSRRPSGVPLVVMLPRPDEIVRTMPLLSHIRALDPKVVIPAQDLGEPGYVRSMLTTPPRNMPDAVTLYLAKRGMLRGRSVHMQARRILELSSEVQSVTALARRLYTSRRTLGRLFRDANVPVPSHWLQFARLLQVCLHLQSDSSSVFRVAHKLKYPDGFTLSNQMKRFLNVRPTEVRALAGWEWIVESWLEMEKNNPSETQSISNLAG